MDDLISRYRALEAERERQITELARAEERLEAAREQLAAAVTAVTEAGFASAADLEKAIETERAALESALAEAEGMVAS